MLSKVQNASAPMQAVAARLDALPFCRLRLALFGVLTLALFADIAEVALGNALGAVFQAPPRTMTQTELSLFLAAIFAGGAAGAPLFGMAGDRFGRRFALQMALVGIALGSLGAAASRDSVALIGFRFLSGLGIGACPPLIAAYMADVMPPRWRGTLSCLCAGLAFLGAPAIIFLTRAASPAFLGFEGWRWALGSGAAIALIAVGLLMLMPESPRWLASVGRPAEADQALRRFGRRALGGAGPPMIVPREAGSVHPVATDHVSANVWRRLLLLCALYALAPWATIGFPLMSGAVMVAKQFSIADSVAAAGLIMFGPALGNLLVASVIDRIGRKTSLICSGGAMAVLGLAFALASSFPALVAIGVAFALASAIYASVLAIYAAEIVPTALRASRTSMAWGLGRFVSIFVPLVCFALIHHVGVWSMFVLISIALGFSVALIAFVGPQGRSRQAIG